MTDDSIIESISKTEPINKAAISPLVMDPRHAYMLGTLVGLVHEALLSSHSALRVSPVADEHGNYLALVRFTLDEGVGGAYSWMLQLVTER